MRSPWYKFVAGRWQEEAEAPKPPTIASGPVLEGITRHWLEQEAATTPSQYDAALLSSMGVLWEGL